ncbi:unnamed protein product [Urochloa humidicola]
MASFGGRGAAAGKHLRVLLPFTCNSLRIPDELAEEIGAGEALIVGPPGSGKEVWPVGVGRDGDGAFLGPGWPEFAGACGVGAGWFLVVRHRGRGLLTVKIFDSSCCLRELGAPPAVQVTLGSKGAQRKPQFISALPLQSLEKMIIPAKFVQHYIPKEYLNNCMTVVLIPLGKIGQIELKMNQSDVFLTGGWSQFMVSQGITGANALLLRFEGNRVFTVKVFEPNGCQRGSRNKDIRVQQDMKEQKPFVCTQKCCRNREKKAKGPMTLLDKPSLLIKAVYEIGPPSWIKKQFSANALKELGLTVPFSDAIGLRKPCTITLTNSTDNMGPWQVGGRPHKNKSYMLRQEWKRFCEENNIMEGDICTFNVVETTLWDVIITRYKEKGTLSASSQKRKSENDMPCSKEQKRLKGSMTSLNKASSTTTYAFEMGPPVWIKKEINADSIEKHFESLSASNWKHKSKSVRSSSKEQKRQKSYKTSLNKASFGIGPPAWIKKEMNASTIARQFCLSLPFCKAIGLLKHGTITLKASMCSSKSWLACLRHYRNGSQVVGSGWTSFCYENGIRVGDVCTFNIVETTLWHVIIEHREASTR